jgi:hypothetical protein
MTREGNATVDDAISPFESVNMTDSAMPLPHEEALDVLQPATSQEHLDEAAIASDLGYEVQDSDESEEGFHEAPSQAYWRRAADQYDNVEIKGYVQDAMSMMTVALERINSTVARQEKSSLRVSQENSKTLQRIDEGLQMIGQLLINQQTEIRSLPSRMKSFSRNPSMTRTASIRGRSITPPAERLQAMPSQPVPTTPTVVRPVPVMKPTTVPQEIMATTSREPITASLFEEPLPVPRFDETRFDTRKERPHSPFAHVDENPVMDSHDSYLSRGQYQRIEARRFGSSFRSYEPEQLSQGSSKGIPILPRTQPPTRKLSSERNEASTTVNTEPEIPIPEDEFEQRVFLTKMDFVQKGKVKGSIHSQRLSETEMIYHARLYQQARTAVRSEVRAAMAEKRDVRFQGTDTTIPVPTTQPQSSSSSDSSGRPEDRPTVQRRPRPSLLLLEPPGENLQPKISSLKDKSIDKTDEMIREIVQDATTVSVSREDNPMNLSKLGIKLSMPEYNGGDTLEGFIRFTKEATKYLSLYNLLRPDYRSYHTDFLGQMLKGKAQTWFNHAIGPNLEQQTSLEDALIALKRYFVKDASSRDSASKFDRLSQGGRTVAELFRELERLSQQMIQTPSDYDFRRRFVTALNNETATAITRFGFTPENNTMEELLRAARQVEQSQFYIERDDRKSSQQPKSVSFKTQGSKTMKGPSKTNTGLKKKEPAKNPLSRSSSSITCHTCKKPGHLSTKCPTKKQTGKAARAAQEINEDETAEQAAEVHEDPEETSFDLLEALLDEYASEDQNDQGSDNESLQNDDSDEGLADWTSAVRIAEESDSISSDEEEEVVYYREPLPKRNKPLADWTEMAGYQEAEEISHFDKVANNATDESDDLVAPYYYYSACTRVIEDDNTVNLRTFRAEDSSNDQVAYRHRATKDIRTEDGPKRNFKNPGIIEGYVGIGEIKAHVLLDCGSTLDMISANFAASSKLDMFQLKKPVKLQMATSGSKSTINFGARAEVKIGEFRQKRYFDVVNLDRYDAILGTPFLTENEVLLNFAGNGSFRISGRWFPVGSKDLKHSSFKEGEGAASSSKEKKGTQIKKSH